MIIILEEGEMSNEDSILQETDSSIFQRIEFKMLIINACMW